jgi:hypothetical protein
MKITPGKRKGLEAVSDSRGVIAAAAMDQRGSLKSYFAKEKGIDKKDVPPQMLEEFKTAVSKALTPHASAILLDPEYGLPAAKARAPKSGLLLAYEDSGYDNTRPGRLPKSTTSSTPGPNASPVSALRLTFRSSLSSSATSKAAMRRASNTPRKSPRSSRRAWKNFRSRSMAWTF